MKYQDFENKLTGQLYNEEMYVNIPSLLQDLGLEKKKRRIAWLPFLLAGILVLLSGYFIYNYKNVSSLPENTDNLASATNTTTQENLAHANAQSEKQSEIIENKNYNSNSNASADQVSLKAKQSIVINSRSPKNAKENNILNPKSGETSFTEPQFEAINSGKANESTPDQELKPNETLNINSIKSLHQLIQNSASLPLWHKDIECPTFSKKSNFYVELIPEVGIFKPFKKLESLSVEPTEAFALRDGNEKSLEGLQAGLYIKLRNTKSPFSFRTGIEYQQLTEKMKLNYEYLTRDTTIGIISITESQSGDTLTIIRGPIITETTHSGSQVAHHQFRTFDVPLVLGYEKSMGNFDLGVEAGISLNVSLRSNGNVLASGSSFTALPDNNLYKSSLGLNYLGSVYLAKNFESIGRFYLAIRGRVIPNSFNTASNSVKQSYTYAGLHLGYIFTL